MSLQANFPTDRPKVFNLVNAEAIDPRLDFSRNSPALFMGKDGFIKKAANNVPRINYSFDPLEKKIKPEGLVLEPDFTNYCPFSFQDDFSIATVKDGVPGTLPDPQSNNLLNLTEALAFAYNDVTEIATRPLVVAPDGVGLVHQMWQQGVSYANIARTCGCDAIVTAAQEAGVTNVTGFTLKQGDTVNYSLFVRMPDSGTTESFRIELNGFFFTDTTLSTQLSLGNILFRIRFNASGNLITVKGEEYFSNFKNRQTIIDDNYPNNWRRITFSAELIDDVVFVCRQSLELVGVGSSDSIGQGFYLWGRNITRLANSSPHDYSLTPAEVAAHPNGNNFDTIAKAQKLQDNCVLDREFLSANTDLISPCMYWDVATNNAAAGVTFFYGTNGDQSNSIAYYQKDLSFTQSVNGVDNTSGGYDSYPRFTLPNGRIKFVVALNTPLVASQDQNVYFSGAQSDIVSQAPALDKISLVTDSINSGLSDLPQGNVAIKAIYIYEGALQADKANALLGSSQVASGAQQPSDAKYLQMRIATDPDTTGNRQVKIKSGNRGLQVDGNMRVLWGDGSNVPFTAAEDFEHLYALAGIYHVQVQPDGGNINEFISGDYNTQYNDADKIVSILDWGESLAANASELTKFAGLTNIISYPTNTDGNPARNIDTSSWKYFAAMFANNRRCTEFPLFNANKATNMANCFRGCEKAERIYMGVSGQFVMPTDQLYSAVSLFNGCALLDSDNYDGNTLTLNTSKCTNVVGLFLGCSRLKSIGSLDLSNLSSGDTSSQIFDGCETLAEIPTITFAGGKVPSSSLRFLFRNVRFATEASLLQIESWDTSGVTNIGVIFANVYSLTRAPNLNTDSVLLADSMFSCGTVDSSMIDGPNTAGGNWDLSSCTDCSSFFVRRAAMISDKTTSKLDISSTISMLNFHYYNPVIERPYFGPGGIESVNYIGTNTKSGCAGIFYSCLKIDFDVNSDGRVSELWPCNTNMWYNAFRDCIGLSAAAFTAILKTLDDSLLSDGIITFSGKYQPSAGGDLVLVNSLLSKGWTFTWS